MQRGFNENIEYNGNVYHVQTEDSGVKRPVITTIVLKEGAIIASKRTNYADVIKFDKLDEVVRDLMKEQHDKVIEDLKNGRFNKQVK